MDADLQTHIAFYLTGKRQGSDLFAVDTPALLPVLFAGYRDLSRLRHDFPLVLADAGVESLCGLIDAILDRIAQGNDGQRLRQHLLRLEQELRTRVANGACGTLSTLWEEAAAALGQDDPRLAESLALARANLQVDGELIDCDAALTYRLLGHAWAISQRQRARKFTGDVDRLRQKLTDIIKAEFVNSDAGKSAENLRSSFGGGPMDSFDFAAMSRLLKKSLPGRKPSASRRSRVNQLLAVLQAQKFYPTPSGPAPYPFAFDCCGDALKAYRQRLPKAIELIRALTMAELEIQGEYSEAKHDALFASFGENGLDAAELALLPDYLVRVNVSQLSGQERNELDEILTLDLPIKILVQTDDVIEESPLRHGHLAFALRSRQLASMALALNAVVVLQSPAASLYQLRQAIARGLDYRGPALFSVFSGASDSCGGLPPYLVGAAALESRAFPAFVFDPSAGRGWASRFSLVNTPQPTLDWPLHELAYADERNQAIAETTAFTLIDFVACDARYGKHFAGVPKRQWNAALTPVSAAIAQSERGALDSVPCLTMVDAENRLHKVIVDQKLIREARRCLTRWASLQELGGIHHAHAERLLASERQRWHDDLAKSADSVKPAKPAESPPSAGLTAPVATAESAAAAREPQAARSPDEAYIETARCSSCNECVRLNDRMFAYDGNQQAIVADVSAGTYAQLVEAAEACPVAIIHPGQPRNHNEPGLDALMQRAGSFLQ
jgi:ferredoxin